MKDLIVLTLAHFLSYYNAYILFGFLSHLQTHTYTSIQTQTRVHTVDSQLSSSRSITIMQTSALMRERESARIASVWRCIGVLMSGSCDRSNSAEKPLNSTREKRERWQKKLCAQCHKTHKKKIREFSGITGHRVIVCWCSCARVAK